MRRSTRAAVAAACLALIAAPAAVADVGGANDPGGDRLTYAA